MNNSHTLKLDSSFNLWVNDSCSTGNNNPEACTQTSTCGSPPIIQLAPYRKGFVDHTHRKSLELTTLWLVSYAPGIVATSLYRIFYSQRYQQAAKGHHL